MHKLKCYMVLTIYPLIDLCDKNVIEVPHVRQSGKRYA